MKNAARGLAGLIALLFLVFGVLYYFAPAGVMETAGLGAVLEPVSITGLSTIRALIGASFLTFGILIVMHSVVSGEDGAMRFAVLFLLISVIGRILSIFQDGSVGSETIRNLVPVSLMLIVSIASVVLFSRSSE